MTPTLTHAAQLVLRRRPVGLPQDEDFEVTTREVLPPRDGQVQVLVRAISVDPAMRVWIGGQDSYRPPVALGEVMPAAGIGQVLSSTSPRFVRGQWVRGHLGAREVASVTAESLTVIDAEATAAENYLGVLGTSGLSAWVGLHRIGRTAPTDTVLVSGAAGSVGSAAVQLAVRHGCRVIGVAGGAAKTRYVKEQLGAHDCLDYRDPDLTVGLRAACPEGINVFFDNVGGPVLEAALDNLALGARVVLSGGVSQYNAPHPVGPANYLQLVNRRASLLGFLVFDHAADYPEATADLCAALAEGQLQSDLHPLNGLKDFPGALRGLFEGINRGKVIVRLNPGGMDV